MENQYIKIIAIHKINLFIIDTTKFIVKVSSLIVFYVNYSNTYNLLSFCENNFVIQLKRKKNNNIIFFLKMLIEYLVNQ